jgi:hypothetical protein
MQNDSELNYVIPAKYRRMENMHIIFWLVKDISWCLIWKVLGLAMIFPTLIISIIIAWRTRDIKSELAHNLAITFWITANSLWMITEFFHFDNKLFFGLLTGKHLSLIPFIIGMVVLLYYYIIQKPKEDRETQVATL